MKYEHGKQGDFLEVALPEQFISQRPDDCDHALDRRLSGSGFRVDGAFVVAVAECVAELKRSGGRATTVAPAVPLQGMWWRRPIR
jgi:hypothetical protein